MKAYLHTKLRRLRGKSRLDLLYQDKWWADQHGRICLTRHLTDEHRANLVRWLWLNARRLQSARELEELLRARRGDWDDFMDPEFDMDPQKWMSQLPLFLALVDQLPFNSRGHRAHLIAGRRYKNCFACQAPYSDFPE